jgi:hypothetical protein
MVEHLWNLGCIVLQIVEFCRLGLSFAPQAQALRFKRPKWARTRQVYYPLRSMRSPCASSAGGSLVCSFLRNFVRMRANP